MNRGHQRTQRTVLIWLLLGLAGYALLPWYFQQDMGLIKALPGVFGGAETASGLVQALRYGKPWLWIGLLGLVVAHLLALHEVGSNNPDGVEIKKGPKGNRWSPNAPADGIPFHPYYTVKDTFYVGFFLILAAFIIFFAPTFGGWFLEHDNFTEANPLVTPAHIKPVWYFTPYYAMLRVVPSFFGIKLWGVLVMFGAIVMLFLLPWLDRSQVKSYRYRGVLSWAMLMMFVVSFLWLAKIGAGPGTDPTEAIIGRVLTFLYFAFFISMPVWTKLDRTKPVPERVTMHD